MEDRDEPGIPAGDDAPGSPGGDDAPAGRPDSVPGAGRARIAGVEAGVAAGLFPSTAAPGPARAPEPGTGPVPLPDWTDPPTREVPRILADPAMPERSVPGPVWREVDTDWGEDDLFADLVEESHVEAAADEEVDPWSAPPSRPAAGLVLGGPDLGATTEPEVAPEVHEEPTAGFEDEQVSLRARVAWAGRSGRHRKRRGEEPGSAPDGEPERSSAARNGIVATVTGLAVGAIALLCFLAGAPAVLALLSLVLLVAMAEWYQALRRVRYQPATLLGLLGAPAAAIAAYMKGTQGVLLVAALLVGLSFVWFLAGLTRRRPVANIAVTVMGWCWVGFLGAFAGLLLSPSAFPHRTGLAYLLGALEAGVAYDVGGYAVGSRFGRHKLAPSISPNKTWEGLAGGCGAAIAVAVGVTSRMHPWTLPRAAALGVVVAVVAPLGDLAESLVKRDLGVKDMGTLLPAHGGLLDRIDALLFVLPATYYLVRLFHG